MHVIAIPLNSMFLKISFNKDGKESVCLNNAYN